MTGTALSMVDPRLILAAVLALVLICSAALLVLATVAYRYTTRAGERYSAYEAPARREAPVDLAAAIRDHKLLRDHRLEREELRRAA